MSLNPALLGALVALQGSNLNQRDRATAMATGLALGGTNLVAGFMVGRGAVAESALNEERTAHAELRVSHEAVQQENQALKQTNAQMTAKMAQSEALAQKLHALSPEARSKLPNQEELNAFLKVFPNVSTAIAQRSEVDSTGKSTSAHV